MNALPPVLALVLVFHVGCSSSSNGERPPDPGDVAECADPRPEVCTQQYEPVCATVDTGIRCVTTPCPSTEERTYPNGCVACSDPEVLWHRPGECDESA